MKNGKTYILIADDEKEIRDILTLLLKGEGYEVISAENGTQVVQLASPDIDLYILDVNMPGMSGFMAGSEIRRQYDTPMIYLTAYSSEADKIMGFSSGADDYIVKPFSNIELMMRIKAILRRSTKSSSSAGTAPTAPPTRSERIQFQDLYLDLDSKSVLRKNMAATEITTDTGNTSAAIDDDFQIISLTYTEFKILELMVTHKKKIYSLENIYQSIWNDDVVSDSSIMVHIKNIRKKLGDDSRNPKYIKTAWGKGYYVD